MLPPWMAIVIQEARPQMRLLNALRKEPAAAARVQQICGVWLPELIACCLDNEQYQRQDWQCKLAVGSATNADRYG